MLADIPSPPFDVMRPQGATRERRTRPRAGLSGQDFFWMAVAGSISACVLLVFEPNRARIREAEAEVRLLRQEIGALDERVAHLRGWERALSRDDPEAWAALAREKLGWLSPGEEVALAGGDVGDARDRARPANARLDGARAP